MDSDDEFDLEKIRAKNVSEIQDMFGNAFAEAEKIVKEVKDDLDFLTPSKSNRIKRKRDGDSLFRFSGSIPSERRTSTRLSKTNPKYSFDDLDKIIGPDNEIKDKDYYYDDMDNLEKIIREPSRKRRSFANRLSLPVNVRPPEEYSDAELNKIAARSSNKIYSQTGTSCHQCRQKTIDTKTVCRSGNCVGVRGQFCGPCLKNRYGENARDALLNPKWSCPPCRNLCNCSICRNKQGKRPTGILAPIIQKEGFVSVKDFLLNLAENGILSKNSVSPMVSEYNRKEENNPIEKESNNIEVIDILIKSYIEKISQRSYKLPKENNKNSSDLIGFNGQLPIYNRNDEKLSESDDLPKNENLSDLIGFNGRLPVYSRNDECDSDLLGFLHNGKYCLVIDNDILYQCLINM